MSILTQAKAATAAGGGRTFWAVFLCSVILTFLPQSRPICGAASSQGDWPMLAHDPARSGATSDEIRPPFERKWYRFFADEGLAAGIQPIIADGRVFVGTMKGTLYAIDSETGRVMWKFRTPGAILHTCAAAGGKVFFGNARGKVYAVSARDGGLAWSVQTGSAVWNCPLVHDGPVVVGSRDGRLYAIDAGSGEVKWAASTGGPLLSSPAADPKLQRVYIGCEDMHVYAFNLRDGAALWRSEKLPGVSFRGYHPVVAPDGSVMVTVTPALSLDSFEPILHEMVKEIFGDFASWRHTKQENERLRRENFELMEKPDTYGRQLDYIRRRLTAQPEYQTFFVFDPDTGRQKFVAPIVYAESMNGTGAPPVVTPDGKVIVKFRALLRSRYQHYSPFLNVGYLDTSSGHITPIMDQSRTYGWHDSLLLVHDEQCQLTVAGRVLINTHQDNVNAMDLDTLVGYGEPFCRNIHEPADGEAAAIWAAVLDGEPVPVGREWLARGAAVYGGGSVIDMPVSVAGDSFYYVPTHEINAGAAVIAYRMKPGGAAGKRSEPPDGRISDQQWDEIRQMSWDWDTIDMPRLNHLLKSLPEVIPGTRRQPLTEEAAERLTGITDHELDRFIWEAPVVELTHSKASAALRKKISEYTRELISQKWRPLVFPPGKHPREAYRFFADPAETLYTLARAYRYLDGDMQRDVEEYVQDMPLAAGSSGSPIGPAKFDPDQGRVRSLYDVPSDRLFRINDDIARSDVARLYPLWLWAHVTNDFSRVEKHWGRLRDIVNSAPNKMEQDCRNGHVAGLIAYCRMAAGVSDNDALARGLTAAREALRERLAYEFAHPRGGLIGQVPVQRSVFSRWRHLTPEVGRLLHEYAGKINRSLMDVYVDYHRPTWYLAWNVELMWRNECPFSFPTMSAEVFDARAMILREPGEELAGFLDIPWCRADLLYIQKLICCIEAHGRTKWWSTPLRP